MIRLPQPLPFLPSSDSTNASRDKNPRPAYNLPESGDIPACDAALEGGFQPVGKRRRAIHRMTWINGKFGGGVLELEAMTRVGVRRPHAPSV